MMPRTICGFIAAVVAAGCAYTPDKAAVDSRHTDMSHTLGRQNDAIAVAGERRPLVTRVAGNWLGVKVKPLAQDANLPPVFRSMVTLKFPGRANLRTIAERLTKVTGIPVTLKPDVFLPVSMFVGTGQQGAGTTAGAPAPAASDPTSVADDMELNFVDTSLRDVLNQICSRFGINFTYQENDGIVFSRLLTRTFAVKANPGDTTLTSSLGKGGSTSGSAGGAGGAGGQSSNFVSNGQVSMNSSFSVWTGIQSVLDTIKSPVGKYFINQATGSLTITDTREVVDVVQRYIETENAVMTQQVGVRVELLSVSASDDDELGVNWNAIFTKLNELGPKWSVNLISPPTLTTPSSGSVGMSVLTPPREGSTLGQLSGSQAMVNALQGYARVTSSQTFSAITLNRQPAPLAKTTQTAYLARTVPGGNAGTGSSTLPGLEPGQVTTGFLSNIVPTVMDNQTVMLQFSIDSSELRSLNVISTGSGATLQSIQTPEIDAVQTVQRVALRSGSTLVLTGFDREVMRYDQRGIGQHLALGGSYVGRKAKETVVILITPMIVDGA